MSAVPRETAGAPAPPQAAYRFFGSRVALAARFAELLAGPGVQRGLLGPREVRRIWERHLLNCAVVHEVMPPGSSVADVGSGAGLPGVVLALHRPDLSVTLVEPMLRRSTFLAEVVAELGLANASVIRARAEQLVGQVQVDVATARAVAPLRTLVGWTLPLLKPGGTLVAVKGASADEELAAVAGELGALGVASWEVRTYGSGVVEPPTRAVVIETVSPVRHPGR